MMGIKWREERRVGVVGRKVGDDGKVLVFCLRELGPPEKHGHKELPLSCRLDREQQSVPYFLQEKEVKFS
jgi:hypothetical protein